MWDGIQFPVALKQINKFEEMNIKSVNVYGIRDETIVPFRISDGINSFINLLYYEGHYSWIKHTLRLFYGQSKHKAKKFFCERCLHTFAKQETLIAHRSDCAGISKTACRIEMPKDTHLEFKDFKKQLPAPYVIYADFEAIIVDIDAASNTKTTKTGRHEVCGYGLNKCNTTKLKFALIFAILLHNFREIKLSRSIFILHELYFK
jgi:hypothetical protein